MEQTKKCDWLLSYSLTIKKIINMYLVNVHQAFHKFSKLYFRKKIRPSLTDSAAIFQPVRMLKEIFKTRSNITFFPSHFVTVVGK